MAAVEIFGRSRRRQLKVIFQGPEEVEILDKDLQRQCPYEYLANDQREDVHQE
jgi:hypothetical protein